MVRDNVTGLIWEVKQNRDGLADYLNSNNADNPHTWYVPFLNEGDLTVLF